MPVTEPVRLRPHDDLNLIRDAAREAGEIAMRHFRRDPKVWWKEGRSPVSEADLAVDKHLRAVLLGARPNHGWLSEETADTPARLSAERTFVVDPIDGTRAFLDGRDTWCVSVAIVEGGRTVAGVIDCPARREIYGAVAGGGVTLNDRPIAVAAAAEAPALGGPKTMLRALPEPLRARMRPVGYVPSLAYRVAMVAKGELGGTFIKPDSHDWDLAAVDLILREAGGAVRDRHGNAPRYATRNPRHGPLAAGSGVLLDAMVGVLAGLPHE